MQPTPGHTVGKPSRKKHKMSNINELEMASPSNGLLPCAYCGSPAVRDGRRLIHCSNCGKYSVNSSHPAEEWNLHMAKVAARKVQAKKPKVINVRVSYDGVEDYNPLHVTIVDNTYEHHMAPKWHGEDDDDINHYHNRREVDR